MDGSDPNHLIRLREAVSFHTLVPKKRETRTNTAHEDPSFNAEPNVLSQRIVSFHLDRPIHHDLGRFHLAGKKISTRTVVNQGK